MSAGFTQVEKEERVLWCVCVVGGGEISICCESISMSST